VIKLKKLQRGRCCFVVVIRSYNWLFCKLRTNSLKFHVERNALAVADIWTNVTSLAHRLSVSMKKRNSPKQTESTCGLLPAKTVPTPLPLRKHLCYEQNLTDCGAICSLLHLLQMPPHTKNIKFYKKYVLRICKH